METWGKRSVPIWRMMEKKRPDRLRLLLRHANLPLRRWRSAAQNRSNKPLMKWKTEIKPMIGIWRRSVSLQPRRLQRAGARKRWRGFLNWQRGGTSRTERFPPWDRKSGVAGKSVGVSVKLGGGRV